MFNSAILNAFANAYIRLIRIFSNFQSIFIFLLRITWGHQFVLAGLNKLAHLDQISQFFQMIHIPLPEHAAIFVSICEVVGGACLFLGLGSRFFALVLSIIMFVAYGTAHVHVFTDFNFIKNPFLLVHEAPFSFLMTSLIVLFFGPGRISLDAWIQRSLEKRDVFH